MQSLTFSYVVGAILNIIMLFFIIFYFNNDMKSKYATLKNFIRYIFKKPKFLNISSYLPEIE